jgi:drug/metabolite transporter (DMT)-like permease
LADEGRWSTRVHELWPLGALCLLSGSRWLVEGALPQTASTLSTEGIGCLMAAGLVGALALRSRSRPRVLPQSGLQALSVGVAGALVLTGPALAQVVAGSRISPDNGTLALALAPLVVAMLASGSGSTEGRDLPGMLWPGLAALTGLLLLLPQPAYSEWRPWLGLCTMPVLVSVGAWWFKRDWDESERRSGWGGIGLGLIGGAVVFAVLWVAKFGFGSDGGSSAFGGPFWSGAWAGCGLDGLSALLALLALQRLRAVRWASQFLFIPFLALLEGMILLRPVLDVRSWVGLALVGLGAAYQLFRSPEASNSVTMLGAGDHVPRR